MYTFIFLINVLIFMNKCIFMYGVQYFLSFYGKEQCEHCLTSSFVINGKKNIRQVWKDMMVSKGFMIIIFWVNCPFKFLNYS